jgi:hypothetical protein
MLLVQLGINSTRDVWKFAKLDSPRRASKISRRPPELRQVPRGSPPVTLFSTRIINSALLPPL